MWLCLFICLFVCLCRARTGMLHPHLPPFPPPPPHHPHPHFVPPSNMITPGGFHRPRHPFIAGNRGPSKPSDALIVRKIPKELNTITKLSSHFEKFGTIVNLTVRLSLLHYNDIYKTKMFYLKTDSYIELTLLRS